MNTNIKIENILLLITTIIITFLLGFYLGGISIGKLTLKDILSPSVIFLSAISATFMAYRTVINNNKSNRIKNTLDAINNEIFIGKKRQTLENACTLLNKKLSNIGSFKAHCRLSTHASEFVKDFKSDNPDEFESIIDAISYADKLCHGVEENIYDKEMINRFLGNMVFDVWWAGMIIIREKELEYLDEINKDYKRKPDFGSPYNSLYNWIKLISDSQNLQQVQFVRGRLDIGYSNREVFKEHEKLVQE